MSRKTSNVESIESKSNSILFEYAKSWNQLTPEICDVVVKALVETVSRTGRTRLDSDDVRKIARLLVVKGSTRMYQTYVRWHSYNYLVDKLRAAKLVWSPRIYIPKPLRTGLVFDANDPMAVHVPLVRSIGRYLYKLQDSDRLIERPSLRQRESMLMCSFLAAAAIVGKVLIDDFHLVLMRTRKGDINLDRCSVRIPAKGSDVYRSCDLPFPASAYLLRLLRFYQQHGKRLGSGRDTPEDRAFPLSERRLRGIAGDFEQWTGMVLAREGRPGNMTILQFRKAAIDAASIDLTDAPHSDCDCPPFILAVKSGKIASYAYDDHTIAQMLQTDADALVQEVAVK